MKNILILFFLVIFSNQVFAQNEQTYIIEEMKQDVTYLASDKMKGREPGTLGEKKSAKYIVEKEGLKQMTDSSEIETIIEKILSENQKMVNEYKSGKTKLLSYFVGQVMKETKGKANPKLLNEILFKKLN